MGVSLLSIERQCPAHENKRRKVLVPLSATRVSTYEIFGINSPYWD